MRTFGARLALWYFALFVAGALIVVLVAALLLSVSLARRDREALYASLVRYTNAYATGGVAALDAAVAADRAAGSYEPVLVRIIAGGRTRMLSLPVEWSRFDLNALAIPPPGITVFETIDEGGDTLEVVSLRLGDGTLFQVGRSAERRDAMLDRFRETALLLLALIALVGFVGGLTLTTRALVPLRELTATIVRILQTGRTSERVAVQGTDDPLDALGGLTNQMLERIDALVGGMRSTLDNVAHDLRTPMTRLRGTAEVALQSGRTADDYREALADCLEEAARVSTLLDSLMDLAEAETGAMRLRRDVLSIPEVVRDAVDLYSELAEDKGLALHLDDEPVPDILGDGARLRQVFANLIDNAVKYTPAPGTVRVTVRQADGGVAVVVADTGPGIAPDEQARVWERLYRGDRSRSARGLGIGLSLVRAIVDAHGGRATLDSQPGQGARFTIWLPAQAAAAC